MVSFPAHLRSAQFGYTMLEMMIVMAVMAILSGIAFFGYRSYEQNAQLRAAQRSLISVLRKAQNQALAGVPGSCGTSGDPTHYALFQMGISSYQLDGSNLSYGLNVQVVDLDVSGTSHLLGLVQFFHPSRQQDSVVWCPPQDCRNHFNCYSDGWGYTGTSEDLTIYLEHDLTGRQSCVRIEGEGLRVDRIDEVACP